MSAVPAQMSPDELALRLHQQELVADFGLFALRAPALDQLLRQACTIAASGLRTEFSKVLQHRPEAENFLLVAGVGWHAGVVGHATLGSGLDSPAGFALHTGEPVLSNHLAQEGRFRTPALLVEHGVQSAINVVIGLARKHPFGVLEVDSTRRHEFMHADMSFLQALANVLAAGIDQFETQQAMAGLLHDKDLLMREVHHRVTNSLQLVRTMLTLQARGVSEETKQQIETASGRIMSIAAVHRRLYQGGSVAEADAAAYLGALLDDMRTMHEDTFRTRSIEFEVEPMMLPADSLTPLGLIVSELVTNAVKYGAGRVMVQVGRDADGLLVTVEDEGDGFQETGEIRSGLGMRLVRSLARGDQSRSVTTDRTAKGARVRVILKA